MNPVIVESLDQEGRGIAHDHGKVIFIEGALPPDKYRQDINLVRATLEKSPDQHWREFLRLWPQ